MRAALRTAAVAAARWARAGGVSAAKASMAALASFMERFMAASALPAWALASSETRSGSWTASSALPAEETASRMAVFPAWRLFTRK